MSAPLAGKFQDHYEVLEVDPKCDLESIQAAYAKLAQKYQPKNQETGDPDKFQAVNLAYETLSDAGLRREFDKVKGLGQEEGIPRFSGLEFFDTLGREAMLRAAVLCVLYDRRRTHPFRPSLSVRQLEAMIDVASEALFTALWYLKKRALAASDDKSSVQITVDGMDFLELNPPPSEDVLPFIKPAALPHSREQAVEPPAASPVEADQGLKVLSRALAMSSSLLRNGGSGQRKGE